MEGVPPTRAVLLGTPKAGAVEPIEALREFAHKLELGAYHFALSIRDAAAQLAGGEGRAITRVTEKLQDRLIPGAMVVEQSSKTAADGFEAYAREVDRIHGEADRIIASVGQDLSTIAGCMETIAGIYDAIESVADYRWDAPPQLLMPKPNPHAVLRAAGISDHRLGSVASHDAYALEWTTTVLRWRASLEALTVARGRWAALISEREAAEARLTELLGHTAIGHLITLEGADPILDDGPVIRAVSGEDTGLSTTSSTLARRHPLLSGLLGSHNGEEVWDETPSAARVAEWWSGLSSVNQRRLIAEVPWVIGNLPGLPFSVRDEANRRLIVQYVSRPDLLSPNSRKALDHIVDVLADPTADPRTSIVSLNLDGYVPFVVIGYGDLDRAHNVTWEVPGMNNDAHRGLPGWHQASRHLYDEQQMLLSRSDRSAEGTALGVFLAYDTPNVGTVFTAAPARDGAPRLAAELDGTVATRRMHAPLSNLSVVAHSYGTPVAANALLTTEAPVQSFLMIASAGLDGDRVAELSDLHVSRGTNHTSGVYSTIASTDQLAPVGSNVSGRQHPDPQVAWSAYHSIGGALIFSSEGLGELKPTRGHSILRDDGHGYFDRGTQSLRSIAALTLGEPGWVSGDLITAEKRGPHALERDSHIPHLGGKR